MSPPHHAVAFSIVLPDTRAVRVVSSTNRHTHTQSMFDLFLRPPLFFALFLSPRWFLFRWNTERRHGEVHATTRVRSTRYAMVLRTGLAKQKCCFFPPMVWCAREGGVGVPKFKLLENIYHPAFPDLCHFIHCVDTLWRMREPSSECFALSSYGAQLRTQRI